MKKDTTATAVSQISQREISEHFAKEAKLDRDRKDGRRKVMEQQFITAVRGKSISITNHR